MRKLSLKIDTLQVQSFAIDPERAEDGTVLGFAIAGTGLQDTNCSAIDRCPSARGCTEIGPCAPLTAKCATNDPVECPSVIDACPSRGCTPVFVC